LHFEFLRLRVDQQLLLASQLEQRQNRIVRLALLLDLQGRWGGLRKLGEHDERISQAAVALKMRHHHAPDRRLLPGQQALDRDAATAALPVCLRLRIVAAGRELLLIARVLSS
jgi:hypothetical protein